MFSPKDAKNTNKLSFNIKELPLRAIVYPVAPEDGTGAPLREILTFYDCIKLARRLVMKQRYANPYIIGVLLGFILLFSFYTMGRGVGSSASFARLSAAGVDLVAPDHAKETPYLSKYI